ncbi:MAG: PAS domain-containing protein [Rhizomicrobium sp.]|jgi:hypothetical protein
MHAQSGEAGLLERPLPPIAIDDSLSFSYPATRQALAYWKSLLDGRPMPSRADLEPRAMLGFMAHVCLIELRQAPDGTRDYFVRLAGTAVEQLFGSLTGQSISEFLPAEIEARWRRLLDMAVDAAQPIRALGRVAFQRKLWLECETLIAPLGADGKTISMLFVAMATGEAR